MAGTPDYAQNRGAFFAEDDLTSFESDHPPYNLLVPEQVAQVEADSTGFHKEIAEFLIESTSLDN